MSELNALPSLKQVRDILKRSGACSRLNDHPLTRTQLFQNYVADHPERSSSPPGEILLWLLFDIWREDMYPEKLWPELAEEWRSYVTLGVIYFLPLLKGKKAATPQKLKAACAKLRRREELILIVARGDGTLANELLQPEYEAFWLRLIPPKKKLTEATLSSRQKTAIGILTKRLHDLMNESSLSQPESPATLEETKFEPVATEPVEHQQTLSRLALDPLSEEIYLQPLEWLQLEPETEESHGLFILRRLEGPSPLDRWLNEPNKRLRLAGELQTIWMMLASLEPTTSLSSIQNWLPASFPTGPEPLLLAKGKVIRFLIDGLLSADFNKRVLRYAVLLQRADLAQPLEMQIRLPAIWSSHRLTGIESLAEAAGNGKHRHFTRAVIRALLAREDYLVKLWGAHPNYHPLVCDLFMALGKTCVGTEK